MTKLAFVVAMGIAVVATGCQASTPRPPQGPAAGAMPPPAAPPPSYGEEAGMMARHHEGPMAGGHPEGAGMREDDHDADERMASHEHHRGGPGMMDGGAHHGAGARWGDARHGRGHEAMRELAALGVRFYPARMVLRRAQEIGLTPDQANKIRQEVFATQARAVDLLAKMGHAKIDIARLLSADKVDEHAVDAQIDEATKATAEMHKLRVGAMLHVRALLTSEQRQKLDERKPMQPGAKPGADTGQMPPTVGDRDDDDDEDEDYWGG